MRMTTKGQYSIVALTHIKNRLALGDTNPVRLTEISKEEKISIHYLEQLFRKLRVAGIVKSIRGPGGGYVLAKEPISYKTVLEAVGESVALRDAIKDESKATNDTIEKMNSIYTNLTKDLEATTI